MRIGGISAPKPVEWTWTTPPNAFRNLQYTVPAKGGAGAAAELIVSGFVGSDGGPLKQNIDRWVGSFAPEGEEPMAPILSEKVIDGMPVHLVELRGRFRDMGGASHPGSLQLGAIVEVPGGRVFIRLIGPESTVEPWRDAWEKLIEGMRKGESPAAPAR